MPEAALPKTGQGSASTHAAAGVGGGAFGAALAGSIAGTWHLDPTVAANWVVVVLGVIGAIGGLVAWYFAWKFPTVAPPPPLGEPDAITPQGT